MNNLTKQKENSQRSVAASSKKLTTVCPQCGGVCANETWHMPDSRIALLLDEKLNRIMWQRCPACEMQNTGLFMGVLYVKNIPEDLTYLVASFVFHEAERAFLTNPQHRIIEFVDIIDGYKLTTTAASMAASIGEKIRATFDTAETQSGYERDPYPLTIPSMVIVTTESF